MLPLRIVLPVLVLCVAAGQVRAEALFEAKNTYAVIAGVLEWSDPGLASFAKEKRKDQALYDTLGALGVPAAQRTLLLDGAASASAIEAAVRAMALAAPAGATLIVYYAGHGVKDQAGHIIFASSEIRLDKLDSTGLHVANIPKLLHGFKGKRVLLLADCCYSGGLGQAATALSKGGLQVMALTSAEASNISTGNWTYTETLIDALSGRALLDRDDNGALTVGELAAEVKDGMRFREGQRSGWVAYGISDELVVAPATKEAERLDPGSGDYERRDWVRAPDGGKKKRIARIIGNSDPREKRGPRLFVEFFDYATATQVWVNRAEAEPIAFETWPVGSELRVRWNRQVYDAKVLKVDNGFMWITYPGWNSSWDEWITAARVEGVKGAEPARKRCQVEWRGRWYDAVLNSESGGKFCISYVGYDASWDECVGPKRIRCQ